MINRIKENRDLLNIATPTLVILYFLWITNTPLLLQAKNYRVIAYISGLILILCLFFMLATLRFSRRPVLSAVLLLITAPILGFCCSYALWNLPSTTNIATCNNVTFYITKSHEFGDYQWVRYYLSKWRNIFSHESRGFGYAPGAGPFELICDEDNNGINILTVYPSSKVLHYSYGERSLPFLHTMAQTKSHRYSVAEECSAWNGTYCDAFIYTLYECELDYTSCAPLPIQYTNNWSITGEFEVQAITEEISFYDDWKDEGGILIFTYGEHPRCYVEGCEILEQ